MAAKNCNHFKRRYPFLLVSVIALMVLGTNCPSELGRLPGDSGAGGDGGDAGDGGDVGDGGNLGEDVGDILSGSLVTLRIVNDSGLEARVEASFLSGGSQVRSTSRLLAADGAEATQIVVPTWTDLIQIVAREAAPLSSSAKPGDLLAEAEITIAQDTPSGEMITFIIPSATIADCNKNGIDDPADIADGTSADCNVNGVPDVCDIAGGTSPDADQNGVPDECERHLFVAHDAAPGGDGKSWAGAFDNLQAALAAAAASGGKIKEVWVAAGVYYPSSGDREAGFRLLNGVSIRGGFAGSESPHTSDPASRDLIANATILSGNIGDSGSALDNICHVVTAGPSTDGTAVLDGFTISAGHADAGCSIINGGGLYNDGGTPTIMRCAFLDNDAEAGGGVYNNGGGPKIDHCTFGRNTALNGAGMYNHNANPGVDRCSFAANAADYSGGGIYNANNSSPTVDGCEFVGNLANAGTGGGMKNESGSSPAIVNSAFVGNWSSGDGGGMLNATGCSPTVVNSTFVGNVSDQSGGGMYSDDSTQTVTNCIFYFNSDSRGTGSLSQIDGYLNTLVINYSCVAGGAGGGAGNIAADPLLLRTPSPGGDGNWDGVDDDFGDLHLQAGSPCIDAGNNGADINANIAGVQPLPPTDILDKTRLSDDPATTDSGAGSPPIVDMGAHEFGSTPP